MCSVKALITLKKSRAMRAVLGKKIKDKIWGGGVSKSTKQYTPPG